MNRYADEDVMWQRLQDIQREVENRRLMSGSRTPSAARLLGLLGRRAWLLAGLAMRRPPRRATWTDQRDATSRVA